MQQLINFIKKYTVLDKAAEKAVLDATSSEFFPKNEFLLKSGQYCNKIWFIKSGLIRRFYRHNSKEITIWIHDEDQWLTSARSFFQKEPSQEYIQACEDSELVCISREASQELMHYSAIQRFSKLHLQEMLACGEKLSQEFGPLSAGEKYQYLFEHVPTILKRAKLGHIASMMGVTQETLSRIRARH